MAADKALNYCGAFAAVLRMMRRTTANWSQWYCNSFALLRETIAFLRESECFGAIFSAEARFAITAITCAITKYFATTFR